MEARQEFCLGLSGGSLATKETNCPVCDYGPYEDIASFERQGLPLQTVLCGRCPTLYSRQVLTEEGMSVFYSYFYRRLYGGHKRPDDQWFSDQSRGGERIMAEIQTHLGSTGRLDGLAVLEIGTGAGGVLAPFRLNGATVIGLDLDEEFLSFGRSKNLDLRLGSISDLPKLPKQDLVILKDVLEHLPRPLQALQLVRDTLTPNGVCYLQVPGFQALRFLGYRNDLLRYLQIAHVVHFTQESLTYLCARAGLDVIYSDRRGVAICRRAAQAVSPLPVPSRDIAVMALNHYYRTRVAASWDYRFRSVLPDPLKRTLRRLRSLGASLIRR